MHTLLLPSATHTVGYHNLGMHPSSQRLIIAAARMLAHACSAACSEFMTSFLSLPAPNVGPLRATARTKARMLGVGAARSVRSRRDDMYVGTPYILPFWVKLEWYRIFVLAHSSGSQRCLFTSIPHAAHPACNPPPSRPCLLRTASSSTPPATSSGPPQRLGGPSSVSGTQVGRSSTMLLPTLVSE